MRRLVVLCVLAGCGRVGFDLRGDAGATADSARDTALANDGPRTSAIQYAGVFVTRHPGPGASDTCTTTAHAAGDVIVIQLGCGSTGALPTDVAMTGTGAWMFDLLAPPTGGGQLATAQLVAIAPDTNPVTIDVVWAGSSCDIGTSVLADEFSGVDTTSGVGGVYSGGAQNAGTGTCQVSFTTVVAAETIWAACFSQSAISGIDPAYTAGAANGGGDAAEYRITTDPPNTPEMPTFANSSDYVIDVLELRPG